MSIMRENLYGMPDHVGHKSGTARMYEALPIVFVVDDDVSVREALEELVRLEGWQPVLFSSAQAFLDHNQQRVPSCLILDVNLPDLSGLDLQKALVVERAEIPIIFITGFGDVPMSVQAMKAGALEFLTKPFSNEVIIEAISNALSRSASALKADASVQVIKDLYASLSRREQQVMELVVSGLMNKQVGAHLGISEITVKAHRGKVMRKMNAMTLADLISMSRALNLTR